MRCQLATVKLRFADGHVRLLPATDLASRPFTGPGVDLRGEPAREAFRLAEPAIAWLCARQPGVALRALSIDLRTRRVLVSFEDAHTPGGKPMVLRIEAPTSSELVDACAPLLRFLETEAATALTRRGSE